MAESYLMSNRSNISFLGLGESEVRDIKNIISLARDLSDNFNVVDDYTSTNIDILLVNFDDRQTIDAYLSYKDQTGNNPALVRCGHKTHGVPERTLKFPVTGASLETTLKNIISTRQDSNNVAIDYAAVGIAKKGNTVNVLVVDDSFPVRRYLGDKLPELATKIDSNSFVNITFASSGRDAIEKMKAAKGNYDLVFLDVIMEDVDGYKICSWIKSARKSIKVVMLTSKDSAFDKVRGRLAGCDAYLVKPPPDKKLEDVLIRFWVKNKHTTALVL